MNTPTTSVLGRRIALPALSLLALGLLFLASALFQQPAYSQSLTSPGAPDAVAPEATPVRTPCPTPVHPPGDKVRLYGDDEILLSYRQANDPRFLNHTVLDNPVGGTALVQTEAAPEMRGRVLALQAMVFLGSTPIGGPIVGWIAEDLGARYALGVGALACLGAGAWGVAVARPAHIDEPATDHDADGTRVLSAA